MADAMTGPVPAFDTDFNFMSPGIPLPHTAASSKLHDRGPPVKKVSINNKHTEFASHDEDLESKGVFSALRGLFQGKKPTKISSRRRSFESQRLQNGGGGSTENLQGDKSQVRWYEDNISCII